MPSSAWEISFDNFRSPTSHLRIELPEQGQLSPCFLFSSSANCMTCSLPQRSLSSFSTHPSWRWVCTAWCLCFFAATLPPQSSVPPRILWNCFAILNLSPTRPWDRWGGPQSYLPRLCLGGSGPLAPRLQSLYCCLADFISFPFWVRVCF